MKLTHITVANGYRALAVKNGCVSAILGPGSHWFFVSPFASFSVEHHNIEGLVFHSRWENHLLNERPDLVAKHFTVVETDGSQLAMIRAAGDLFRVLLPGKRLSFWKDAVAQLEVEFIDVIDRSDSSESLLALLDDEEEFTNGSRAAEDDSGNDLFDALLAAESSSEIT
jgi:hypothetical protein